MARITAIFVVRAAIAELQSLLDQWEAEDAAWTADQIIEVAQQKARDLADKIASLKQ